jgi:hypothetical protein
MSSRFRRSIRICRGLHLNLSKSGVSASIGIRGATVNVSGYGVQETVGLPGTGLSYRNPSPTNRNVLPTDSDQTSKLMAMARRLKSRLFRHGG